jgi:uncharacterized protein YegP (UPF0339 family)
MKRSPCIVIYLARNGEYRWRLLSANSKIIADSGEGYKTRRGINLAVRRLRQAVPIATIVEGT